MIQTAMEKQVCNRCVMDNTADLTIRFNSDGTCNYCNDALRALDSGYFPNDEGKRKLEDIFGKIKKEGRGKQYDCMMGLSGGLDSSYAALIGWKYGLRILMVHIDDGLDAPVTSENIKRICNTFNFDLVNVQPDKPHFADLTRAFILAGLPDIATPQDNVLLAALYSNARKNRIKYLLSGENFSLESITQSGMDASDKVHILDVHKKFGKLPLKGELPLFSIFEKQVVYKYLYGLTFVKPLNYIEYNFEKAFKELNEACGYEYYGSKHWESRLTRFVQCYYLPLKFNIDKRKSHLSSLIVSGQIRREEALKRLKEPLFDEITMQAEITFLLEQLSISREEFDRIMKEAPHEHSEFRSSKINKIAAKLLLLRKKISGY